MLFRSQGSTSATATGATTTGQTTIGGVSGVTGPTGATGATPIGNASFAATGLDFTSVAAWIQRIGEMPSFTNLWVPNATRDAPEGATRTLVTYSSTADITSAAVSDRAARYGGRR